MKIAFVSPMILPVSDTNGGSLEQLMLSIVRENENNYQMNIDLYTIDSDSIQDNYKYTNVIKVKVSIFDKFIQKICNTIKSLLKCKRDYMAAIEKCVKIINRNEYDKIVIENNMFLYKRIYKKSKYKENLYYHMHNDFNEDDKTYDNYIFIEKTCCKIFTVSEFIKQRLLQVKTTNKIEVLNNCIDYKKLSPSNIVKEEKEKIKLYNNIQKEDFIISYIGRVIEEKGILQLVRAFKKISEKYKNAKLLIVGASWFDVNSKKTEFEEKLIEESKSIEDKIIFTGYVSYKNIAYYYLITNVFVIPSICNDAAPLSAIEALYYNLPIISTEKRWITIYIARLCFIC